MSILNLLLLSLLTFTHTFASSDKDEDSDEHRYVNGDPFYECMLKTNTSPQQVEEFARDEEKSINLAANNRSIKCYILCILEQYGLLNGCSFLQGILPMSVNGLIRVNINSNCFNVIKNLNIDDKCECAFEALKCMKNVVDGFENNS
ncbi:uncharacterized protein LOC129940488 [Eupeodes corollae]|uniref:uncharacterized protein LOC129940488 n=1 Tax=Eupeodes corollae TaxID=290404 RepID=UPI002493366A|nr:uncharacterized protein LOC129940488 [Eupeodes corollae]